VNLGHSVDSVDSHDTGTGVPLHFISKSTEGALSQVSRILTSSDGPVTGINNRSTKVGTGTGNH
jgi:hypothetical protein